MGINVLVHMVPMGFFAREILTTVLMELVITAELVWTKLEATNVSANQDTWDQGVKEM